MLNHDIVFTILIMISIITDNWKHFVVHAREKCIGQNFTIYALPPRHPLGDGEREMFLGNVSS